MSETTWHLSELREHIRFIMPLERRAAASEIVHSIDRSISIFLYQLYTARDALHGHLDEAQPTSVKNVLAIFDGDNEEMSRARIISEAHILGCIHTARASLDIFAQLVNLLVLNSALSIEHCNIHKVRDELPASTLKSHLAALLATDAFKYIAAFINVTKHRQLIRHALTVSMTEDRVGIRMGAFEYGGVQYPQRWGREVLEASLSVSNGLIGCGRALNDLLLGAAPPSDTSP